MYKHTVYFLIGCPRTGSTFLYNILKTKKDINLLPKENHFFLTSKIFRKKNYYDTPKYQLNTSINYYLKKLKINQINYDINTLYFYDLRALKIIKKNFPNSKFFCFLRDPVSRHYSHSMTQIKKYFLYRELGDFDFPLENFYNLKKSMVFQNTMLSFSNYKYFKNLLKKNKIKCKYYNYEHLFMKKINYINFLKEIKVSGYKRKNDERIYSLKNYPIKLYDRSYYGKIKSLVLKKFYKKKINDTLMKFKKIYPFNTMKKLFFKNIKNLRHFYITSINIK